VSQETCPLRSSFDEVGDGLGGREITRFGDAWSASRGGSGACAPTTSAALSKGLLDVRHRHLLLVSAAACATFAAQAALADEAGPTPVDELVVTANRAPERADRVGGQITVLDRADLEAQQTPVLSDILARTPGISFSRNGGVGEPTQLYIRGANPGETVVLIDGVKLNDPTATDESFNFGNLLVGDISRVEILRGPQSVLWGSQAIGGVVNLITAAPSKPFEADATAEGGSHDWGYGRVGVGGTSERVAWRASAAYLTTSGISAFDQAFGGRETDGDRNVGGSARADVKLTDDVSLDLRAVYQHSRSEFDGYLPPNFVFGDDREYGFTDNFVGYAGLNFSLLGGRLKNRIAYQDTETHHENFNPDQDLTDITFKAAGRNHRVEYQGTYALWGDWQLVFGAEHEESRLRTASPSEFDPDPARFTFGQEINGGYLQVHGDVVRGLTVSGGVREDGISGYGKHTVGQASVAWKVNGDNTILRASWGQGFKAPTLYQLGSEYGNPNLKPEQAQGWDAGVQQLLFDGRATVNVAYFRRTTSNEIDFFDCNSTVDPLCTGAGDLPRFGYYANIGRTKAQGVELEGHAQITQSLAVDGNYTWTDARNDTEGDPDFGNRLARRPAQEANAEATYSWSVPLTTTVAVHHASSRFDDEANTVRLKGYWLCDLRADYALRPGLDLYGRIENLFDRHYETIYQFGQLGRAAYFGVRAKF
jgi:vitamin B12 transporter